MEKKQATNPYDDWDEYFDEKERQRLNSIRENVYITKRHTDVFKTKDIREFANHMGARSREKTSKPWRAMLWQLYHKTTKIIKSAQTEFWHSLKHWN